MRNVLQRGERGVREPLADALRHVRTGDRVEEVELFPSAEEAWDWHKAIMESEMAANFEAEWMKGRDQLSGQLRSLIERGRETRAVDYAR